MVLPRTDQTDAQCVLKRRAARIFWDVLQQVKKDEEYIRLANEHREQYEKDEIPEDTTQFEEDMDVKEK